jgi:hypothetical protein
LAATNWQLLVFLLLFIHVKLVIKLVALLWLFAWRRNGNLGFRIKNSRLPLFYPAMMLLAITNWLLQGLVFNGAYGILLLIGLGYWILCIAASHQLKLAVEVQDTNRIHRTLFLFFIINISISFFTYLTIVLETGAFNPYLYQGQYQKYFINTGDYIRGVSFDTSTTNSIICALGVLYFLQRQRFALCLLCMICLLLTGSNMVNILLTGVLAYIFVFASNRNQKTIVVTSLLLLLVFLLKVSPQNNRYLAESWQRVVDPEHPLPSLWILKKDTPLVLRSDSTLTGNQLRMKTARLYIDSVSLSLVKQEAVASSGITALPKEDIHSQPFQYRQRTNPLQQRLDSFVVTNKQQLLLADDTAYKIGTLPGKLIAWQQLITFYRKHPALLVTGTGMGNFSSRLAFKATGLGVAGSYPARWRYMHPYFLQHHLDLYLQYFARQDGKHSVLQSPHSVYGQLLGEYGLLGIIGFLWLYIGYFAKQYKNIRQCLPLLFLLSGILATDYWFEQLSVLVLFELLLYIGIKEQSTKLQV